jgi:hypothetical protein
MVDDVDHVEGEVGAATILDGEEKRRSVEQTYHLVCRLHRWLGSMG